MSRYNLPMVNTDVINISYIVVARNGSNYLQQLIPNFEACEYTRSEIIFIIDSSTDNTLERIRELTNDKKISNKIKTEIVNFGNPGSSRNYGAGLAKGEWIVFLDVDDIPLISEYEKLIRNVPENIEIIVGQYLTLNAIDKTKLGISSDFKPEQIEMTPGVWRMIFRREILRNNEFSNLSLGEDHNFLMNLKFDSRNVEYFQDIVYQYFKNVKGQLTTKKNLHNDLRTAIENNIAHTNIWSNSFIRIMILNEGLTFLKIAPISSKISFIKSVSLVVLRRKPNELFLLFKTFILILKYKLVGQLKFT